MVSDLLKRKSTHFILWAPKPSAQPPRLILGELQLTNPVSLVSEQSFDMTPVAGTSGLWEVAASAAALQGGKVYHYWFEVADTKLGRPPFQRIRVTDPAAFIVDWRIRAPALPAPNTDVDRQPAAVIRWHSSGSVRSRRRNCNSNI
jgi:pullulanase